MQEINVNELKPHPKNSVFFDDMSGDVWDALIQSITTSGITNAITIDQDNFIISGHQRVRACKVLGIEKIPYRRIDYKGDISKELKDLIESNLRQRVIGNANPIKLGKCFQFLNDWYGFKNGGDRKSEENNFTLKSNDTPNNQLELAESYGITKQTMSNYIRLTKMIPELEDLVDTGITTPTTALAIMRNLSEPAQLELISSMDTTKKITQKEVQKYIDKNEELESRIKKLESKQSEIQVVEKEIDNTDYSLADANRQLEKKCEELELMNKTLKVGESSAKNLADSYKKDSDEYRKLKGKMLDMNMDNLCEYNIANAAIEITNLSNKVTDLLINDLSPVKYKQFIETVKNNKKFKGNFAAILCKVKDWYEEMYRYLGINENENDVIDMEEN